MLRYALAVYFLLLSLTGPNPCCCTLAQFAELTLSWVRAGERQEVQCPTCCQVQFFSHSTENQDESQSACLLARSESPTRHCRCEKNVWNALSSQSFAVSSDHCRSSLDDLTLNVAASWLPEVGEIAAQELNPGGAVTARSGREIRIANHSWLC